MEELRLWVRDLGFPIVVAIAAIYALYKMFLLREGAEGRLKSVLELHAKKVEEISVSSNNALGQNTEATQQQTKLIEKLLEEGVPVKIDRLVSKVDELIEQGAEAAKLLADKAILIATVEPRDGEHRPKEGSP